MSMIPFWLLGLGALVAMTIFNLIDVGRGSFPPTRSALYSPHVPTVIEDAQAQELYEIDPSPRGLKRQGMTGFSDAQLASYITCQRSDIGTERICHLENVCWDREVRTFTFFSNPKQSTELLVHDNGIVPLDDPSVLARLVRTVKYIPERSEFLPLKFEKAFIPLDQAQWHSPHVHVAFTSFWAENFGHALGDDIMPAYSLMKAFNLETDDVQLMTIGDCCKSLRQYGQDLQDRVIRNLHNMTALISRYPLIDTEAGPFFSSTGSSVHTMGNRYTCVRHLLAGHGSLGLRFDRDFAWSSFIDTAIHRAKHVWPQAWENQVSPPPSRRLILVVKKDGRRRILNHESLVERLQAHFSDGAQADEVSSATSNANRPSGRWLQGVDVISIDPAALSLPEQIALCQKADLVITPCGGISFFASFLPKGKAAIFLGYWDTETNRSENMEGFLWRYVTRQVTFFYDVKKDEITILPPGDPKRSAWADYRDHGAITVDEERMIALAEQALRMVIHD